MKKYSTYKDSGVDGGNRCWIGEIPEHWEIKSLKFVADKIDEEPINTDFLIAVENIESFTGKLVGLDRELEFSGSISGFRKGDTIFNKLRPYLSKVYFTQSDGGLFGELLVIRPKDQLVPEFQYYILSSRGFIEIVNSSTEGTKMPRANWETSIKLMPIVIPPLPEQQAIVTYLDEKTTLIDDLIKKKQEKIQLLKENRTALINHTVTKGLDPEVKMKDSGVEWIGEIPEHWSFLSFRYCIDILTDFTSNGSFASLAKNVEYKLEGYSRLIRLTDLRVNLKNEGIYVNEDAHKFLSNSELFGEELLIANVGAYAGLAKIMPVLNFKSTLGPNMFLLRLNQSNFFYHYLLNSPLYAKYISEIANSTAQPKLNKENVRTIQVVKPPISEQNQIITYLDEQTQLIDQTIQQEEQKIELLKEYRQSLISEVVTGKICVV